MKTVVAVAAIAVVMTVLASIGTVWSRSEQGIGEDATLLRVFNEGNEFYRDGDYEGALKNYGTLVEAGVVDATLFYNLANTYYKTNQLGEAVVLYERARRLSPRDRDVRENLALVRSQLRDKQFVQERNRLARLVVLLHDNLSTSEMLLFASIAYVVLSLLVIILIFRESTAVVSVYRWISVLSPGRLFGLSMSQDLMVVTGIVLFLFVTAGWSGYTKLDKENRRSEAIVMIEEIPVFASPTDDATLQFKIHEGTMVKVREERRGWTRVQLPGRLSGWITAASIERI